MATLAATVSAPAPVKAANGIHIGGLLGYGAIWAFMIVFLIYPLLHLFYDAFTTDTGEFTLARRDGKDIAFLLRLRHQEGKRPSPVPFDTDRAEPMRRALSGMSGTLIGKDYRGAIVLAAHEPIAGLGWGVVAKIDLAEIREPYVRAGVIAAPGSGQGIG